MKQLDFSVGQEPVIFVRFEGRAPLWKETFLSEAGRLPGVTKVAPAGGNSGAYVYYDTDVVGEESLSGSLAAIVGDI